MELKNFHITIIMEPGRYNYYDFTITAQLYITVIICKRATYSLCHNNKLQSSKLFNTVVYTQLLRYGFSHWKLLTIPYSYISMLYKIISLLI